MDSKDLEKSIHDNNEDIALENKKIERANKKIAELSNGQDKQIYYERIKKAQISICELQKENEERKLEIRKIEIKSMKDYLNHLKEKEKFQKKNIGIKTQV